MVVAGALGRSDRSLYKSDGDVSDKSPRPAVSRARFHVTATQDNEQVHKKKKTSNSGKRPNDLMSCC